MEEIPIETEVLAVDKGIIVYEGTSENIKFNAANKIDLKGRFLMPGL